MSRYLLTAERKGFCFFFLLCSNAILFTPAHVPLLQHTFTNCFSYNSLSWGLFVCLFCDQRDTDTSYAYLFTVYSDTEYTQNCRYNLIYRFHQENGIKLIGI